MRIQFIIEVYVFMCGHFFMVRIDMDPFLWHCWAVYHFHGYLDQMPKALSQSFYISRIEKDWEFWLNYSDDLLEIIEKSLSYKPFVKH